MQTSAAPVSPFAPGTHRTLAGAFAAAAAAVPAAPAVTDGAGRLTYLELAARAQAVAHCLRQHGVGPGSVVAVRIPPCVDLIVTVLGIVFAGAAYLPLGEPAVSERDSLILADARPCALVAAAGAGPGVPLTATTRLQVRPGGSANPVPPGTAYVIYTSGTTGRPKGTPIGHRNVLALFAATAPFFGFTPADRWLLFHSVSFDFSVWEIWGALLHGGCLVVPDQGCTRYPDECADLIRREGITVLNQTPTAFGVLSGALASAPGRHALRYLIFGGERLQPSSLVPWASVHGLDAPAIVNMYGITETTVHATLHRVTERDLSGGSSVIGRPLPGFRAQIAGERDEPAAAGELLLAGPQVAAGYLNRPRLTAARFVSIGTDVFYRTGDVVAERDDGELCYLGRRDDQVKVRGHRVELGEVEAALLTVPGVSGVIVATFARAGGEPLAAAESMAGAESLGCVYTGTAGAMASIAAVRAHLRDRLPGYMVPARFHQADALPRTPNGKADRQRARALLEGRAP
jgi:amino acid adenylation domain-containing protein